jgi:hypothetical protein
LQPDDPGGFLHLPQRTLSERSVSRIEEHGNTHGLGHQLMQETQPLGDQLVDEKIDAGRVAARPREAGDKTKLDRSSPTPNTIGIVAVAALAAIEGFDRA